MPRFDNPRTALATARYLVRQRTPYFASALLSLAPREAKGLGTVGVTNTGILLYDPEAIAQWTSEELAGALAHEVLHLLHEHFRRFKGVEYPILANYAQDLAINDSVLAMGYQLPKGGLFPKNFDLATNQTAEWYYSELLRRAQEIPASGAGKAGKAGRGSTPSPPGSGSVTQPDSPCAGGGWCGSCAGRPMPGEPEENDPAARTPLEMERTRRATAEEIRSASKQVGSVPADLMRWADGILAPPKIRWQDRLARYARATIAATQAGLADYTYGRLSRRTAGYSEPGEPVRPSLCRPVPNVCVALDTSGSMAGAELAEAMSEIRGILTSAGAGVTFIACDAAVHSVAKVKTWQAAAALLKGGGGTDFHPIFEAATKLRPKPDVIVIATDGYGPAPKLQPMPTIWLLVGESHTKPCDWGLVVETHEATGA